MTKTFTKGSTTFKCQSCGHLTRHTGTQSVGSKTCPVCYELAGYYNMLQDGEYFSEGDYAQVLDYVNTLRTRGSKVDGEALELEALALSMTKSTETPVATRTAKYDYPAGLTAQQKKVFRAKARRNAK